LRLHCLKTKDNKKVDFLVVREETPALLIEVKWADQGVSRNFSIFETHFPGIEKIQIAGDLRREKTYPHATALRSAHNRLAGFSSA
jgi:hypothetical protein